MSCNPFRWRLITWTLALAALVQTAAAQVPQAPPGGAYSPHSIQQQRPAGRVARNEEVQVAPPEVPPHPLTQALEWAQRGQQQARRLRDYSCVFAKRERIDGVLSEYDYMFLKIRHQPFSVYLYCLGPLKPKGQEAIYVEGRNEGMVLAHTTGLRDKIAGTLSLHPTSARMMEGNLYPITNIGMENLTTKLINMYQYEMNYGECDVKLFSGAKVDQRECTCVQVVHPVPRRNFKFHLSRAYYDETTGLPIRFEAYSWPARAGEAPVLIEEYTYQNLKLDAGFSDADFDTQNPSYGYR